jgi:3-hydroxyacyl-CoA dehydrogenase/enoyl-CoA hydratase/3-hydroxybutyryl-CoA epimerase
MQVATRTDPAEGVALLTFAPPSGGLDPLDTDTVTAIAGAIEAALADPGVRGIVITFAGAVEAAADPAHDAQVSAALHGVADPAQQRRVALARVGVLQTVLRHMETAGKPAVAALSASTRGAAFEVALACHRRLVADDAALRLGAGGVAGMRIPLSGATQRLVRMAGAMAALGMLLEGASLSPAEALKAKLVDEIVPAAEVIARAVAWVQEKPEAVRPWDTKTFRLPGADPRTHHGGGQFAVANALQRKRTGGKSPAADAVQQLAYQACLVPMDVGLRLESKYAAKLLLQAAAP